jgi:hypothetical protein
MQSGDLRGWLAHLSGDGVLHEVDAEVDLNCEPGTIARRDSGNGEELPCCSPTSKIISKTRGQAWVLRPRNRLVLGREAQARHAPYTGPSVRP